MPDENRRPEIDFDHHSNDFAQRSIEIFSDLRAHCPVAHTKHHGGYWVATRYEDVATVARDDETFSSEKRELPDGSVAGGITIPSAVGNPIPIETDPPEFFSFRKLLNPYFSPAAVERLRPRIQQLTDECIDSCIESGEIDLVLDLANPVPTIITVEILGLPRELWQRVADAAHAAIYTPPPLPGPRARGAGEPVDATEHPRDHRGAAARARRRSHQPAPHRRDGRPATHGR